MTKIKETTQTSNEFSLKNFATPLKAKDHFIKFSIGGFAGSGKTKTASDIIKGCYTDLKIKKPLLLIDNEKGSRFLVKSFKDAGIETFVKETVQVVDVLSAFKLLNNGEIGFLFIDSLSKVWYQYVRDYKAVNNKTFMTLQDWGKILPSWQEMFSDKFVDLNGNCGFTGRGGFTYDMEEDDNGKKAFAKSGVKMKLAGETPFEPDINIWMELHQEMKNGKTLVWREAQIMKDRSGMIDGMTFKNPKYKDFQPVVKYLIDVPIGEVAGETSTRNLAPAENFEYLRNRDEKEKLFSEIKGVFDLYGFGGNAGKEAKQQKTAMINKVFGTVAFERIQSMDNQILADGMDILKEMFLELENIEQSEALEFIKNYDTNKNKVTVDNLLGEDVKID